MELWWKFYWCCCFCWFGCCFLLGFGVLFFNFIVFMTHEGYLHAVKALSMYVNSSSSWSWLEQMFFALCTNELITLYLLAMAWWLSHCKYWLVWVGFLYMEVDKLPSPFAVTKLSRKGNDQNKFFGRHKLLPILLIWLHLVYGKIISLC